MPTSREIQGALSAESLQAAARSTKAFGAGARGYPGFSSGRMPARLVKAMRAAQAHAIALGFHDVISFGGADMAGFGELRRADEQALNEARGPHLLTQASGLGYYPLPGSPMNWQYASMYTIQAIQRVVKRFYDGQKIPVGIGDLSKKQYGAFPPHSAHKKGTSVDIRPIRKDRAELPVTWQQDAYDRATTKKLVECLLAEPNVKKVLFNDPQIPGVHYCQGHDNHLHAEMKM
jgi:hypothetical protein